MAPRPPASDPTQGGTQGPPAQDPLESTRRVAVEIARDAGRVLLEGWGTRPDVGFKSEDINLVTEYDRRSEALVVARLAQAFPQDRIVAEEGTNVAGEAAAGGERVWYVDPLDGTTNFAHGLPLFSVSLGLAIKGRPVLGVVEAPALGWSFAGSVTRGGSTFNGKPIVPSRIDRLAGALLVSGFPYQRNPVQSNLAEWTAFTAAAQGTRRLGSAALDLCFVACGWLDGYWERALHPWDLVGGAAIVLGAGGQVTDLDGSPFDGETGRILASNGLIHDQMTRILQGVARRANAPWP
jgi:myo-inositol-1(or 4)-monophosphatase